jgi:hypothetical protein
MTGEGLTIETLRRGVHSPYKTVQPICFVLAADTEGGPRDRIKAPRRNWSFASKAFTEPTFVDARQGGLRLTKLAMLVAQRHAGQVALRGLHGSVHVVSRRFYRDPLSARQSGLYLRGSRFQEQSVSFHSEHRSLLSLYWTQLHGIGYIDCFIICID